MKLTRNGKLFTLVNLLVVGSYFKGVDYYGNQTNDRGGAAMIATALLAMALLFLAAWFLLHRESERQHKVNLGLVYHLITAVTAVLGWGVAYKVSDHVQPIDLAWIVALGSASLLIHWLLTRNKTKGIDSKKAFL